MLTRRSFLAVTVAVPAVAALSVPAQAAEPPVFQRNGFAISGYDPVAYFTEGKPVKGDPAYSSEWNGATMLFSSAETKAMFDVDPEKYAPQYGGYCAYAVSKGYTAKTEPDAWSIFEDKLYLNFSKSVRALWSVNKRGHIQSADANWPAVLEG